ncbi:lipopolysaccharide biosynthesis protein [Arthrobacter sp. B3I4]|uniref:lipopolysaccharide biosynthesis protein n=1 Tax=Arthrobacter sp. B3I4 TaxID=3042267 RepID=UPI00278068D1|nr:oligosaccharide flippase family protein [Arthrobacter sp. B3I4]MDQ0755763.1 O-antigen/teichoic acid export membrane protein [Arthrobacter sp. B3I4]
MIRSTIWLTLALAFRSLGQAGLLIVFARFGSPETLGSYSLALAVTAPIFVFCEFGLRTVYLTHRGNQPFSAYLRVRLATLGLAMLLTAAIGAVFVPEMTGVLLLVSLLRAADSVGELYSAPLQRHGELPTILRAFSTNAVLTIGVGIGVLAALHNLYAVIAALIVVSSATTLFLMKRPTDTLLAAKEPATAGTKPPWEDHLSVVRAGLPTGISWGLLSLLSSIPQYFLAAYYSQVEVGYFAIILYVVVVVEIFLNAVSQSWIPRAKKMLTDAPSFFRAVVKTALLWTAAFVPLSAVVCAAAYLMLPIIFGSTYRIDWAEIIPLFGSLVVLPLVFFSAMALNVANSYVKALTTSVVAVVLASGVAFAVIPDGEVPGALWVSFAALASRSVLSMAALALGQRKRAGQLVR